MQVVCHHGNNDGVTKNTHCRSNDDIHLLQSTEVSTVETESIHKIETLLINNEISLWYVQLFLSTNSPTMMLLL